MWFNIIFVKNIHFKLRYFLLDLYFKSCYNSLSGTIFSIVIIYSVFRVMYFNGVVTLNKPINSESWASNCTSTSSGFCTCNLCSSRTQDSIFSQQIGKILFWFSKSNLKSTFQLVQVLLDWPTLGFNFVQVFILNLLFQSLLCITAQINFRWLNPIFTLSLP